MRMLLALLLILNAAIAVYYVAVAEPAPQRRPQPGPGTLTLVSEMAAEAADTAPSGTDARCWRSAPVARGEPLQTTLAAVGRNGFEQLRLTPVSSGYAVLLARAATIQDAAAELERLGDQRVAEPRVRPGVEGGLAVVSGRFDSLDAARAHARDLRDQGIEASVLQPEATADAVRVYVRGGAERGAPPGTWERVNCQAARR